MPALAGGRIAGQHRPVTGPGDKIVPFSARPKSSGHWEEIGGRLYYVPTGPGPHPAVRELTLPKPGPDRDALLAWAGIAGVD
jgi:hypothetical protein